MYMPALKRSWTVEDVHALPDDGNRYEVIDGELFVTPAPAWRHQYAVGELYRRLHDYVRREGIGYAFIAPADVVFTKTRAVQPDIFVVPLAHGRRPEHFDEVHQLMLAVEILSPTTARADRVAKRTLYRDEQVGEYWIVDLDARVIERVTPLEPRSEILAEELMWRPAATSASFSVDLPRYFDAVLNP
jgi:Uma2 family endonuclease